MLDIKNSNTIYRYKEFECLISEMIGLGYMSIPLAIHVCNTIVMTSCVDELLTAAN
jgi:hypothetical protein